MVASLTLPGSLVSPRSQPHLTHQLSFQCWEEGRGAGEEAGEWREAGVGEGKRGDKGRGEGLGVRREARGVGVRGVRGGGGGEASYLDASFVSPSGS